MASKRLILILIVFGLASLACFATGTQPTSVSVLFFDDFSDNSKKWDQYTGTSYTTAYYNNAYRIIMNDIHTDTWANPGKESFIDTRIEVDAIKNNGPDDNDFGIICRYTGADSFYYALISSDGYFSIMKMTAEKGIILGRESMHESDRINRGAASNHIRFDCIGSTLTLYANGFLLDEQTDIEYTAGNVGLISGALDTAGTDILFDNFYVFKP